MSAWPGLRVLCWKVSAETLAMNCSSCAAAPLLGRVERRRSRVAGVTSVKLPGYWLASVGKP